MAGRQFDPGHSRAARENCNHNSYRVRGRSDPVGQHFVAGSRTGGGATGFTNWRPSMTWQWLEMLKRVAPQSRERQSYSIPRLPRAVACSSSTFGAVARTFAIEPTAAPAKRSTERNCQRSCGDCARTGG